VTVAYTGWLADGKSFASSRQTGRPATFPIGQNVVMPGWDEAILSMHVGGKRHVVVPPRLGYAASRRPANVPGGATLVFDFELLG
jgi:peptidylprolyl isomerase